VKRETFFTLFCILLYIYSSPLLFPGPGEIKNTGFKYFKNYRPSDYDNVPQNWCILQDKQGSIYAANQGGLLIYDGSAWRSIDIPNKTVRALAIDDKSGTIYVGGMNEIGFLEPDSRGTLQYISLLPQIEEGRRNFATVWRAHSTPGGVYFYTSYYLFRWQPVSRRMRVWKPEPGHRFNASFSCNGELFVHQRGVGLMQVRDNALKPVAGGETFASVKIFMMAPYNSRQVLIGTRANGFFLYGGSRTVPFPTGADDYLKEKQLCHGIALSSGEFALATLQGGLVIIDARGKLKYIFNTASGLPVDNVKYVFEDLQGNLWLALVKGITRIEYASPISIYDDRSNLPELVLSVVKHGDALYAGTTSGLYVLTAAGKFRPIPEMPGNCFSLLSIGKAVLAATTYGVFQIDNNIKRRVIGIPSYVLYRSVTEPRRAWVGTRQGLVCLYSKNGRWQEEYHFKNITQEIRTIVEDPAGNLWLGTRSEGAVKVGFPADGTIREPQVVRYDSAQRLPAGEVHVYRAAGHVMLGCENGLFRFDERNNVFMPDLTLGEEFADGSRNVFRLVQDKNSHVWFHSEFQNFRAVRRPDGTYFVNAKPFLRISRSQVDTIYPDPSGEAVWFASHDGLIRYDTTTKKNYNYSFSTLIRRVAANENLIFDGYKSRKSHPPEDRLPVIGHRDRNLHFEFAAPCFEAEAETRYRCFLAGYDSHWSAWNREPQKEYTNLDAGSYTFRVQARDVYGNLGREEIFRFRVLPPWYQTWWAFLLYALASLSLVFLTVRWRSWKLRQEKQRLEQIVKDRTGEINRKNRQLEEQSGKLKEMDQIKSRFFANISHEFRTPLTLIMGPLEQMIAACPEQEQKRKLRLMLRNSQRLLGLINQLLELSRFDSGKAKLKAGRHNIVPFLKGIVASFDYAVRQRDLDLTFHTREEDIVLYFDAEKIEAVVANLLINALKFTPAGGEIKVYLTKNPEKEPGFPEGSLDIAVTDTGPGIAQDQLSRIFDRFYQLDTSHEHHQDGSGIGLAIVREVVELHHGKIDAKSEEGRGTVFTIRLPSGDSHLKPEEIVEAAAMPTGEKSPRKIPVFNDREEEEHEGEIGGDREPQIAENGTPQREIILVVEDNADVGHYIREALEPAYTVLEAKDGEAGIREAREAVPDLIVSDIMMPGIDGYELCRVLKNDINTSHIPIILLTARAAEEDIVEGLQTKADDYITKPFNTRIVLARIKNLIDLRRSWQQKVQREMKLEPGEIAVSSMDQKYMKELQQAIEKNLSDPEFNVDQMCGKLYMGRTSLYRKIMALTGESPVQFIRSYRLKRGLQLLKANYGNVTEVAFAVGFSSTPYFTKCFKEKFHQLPSVFQASEQLSPETP
jgi:signal transduction histidine kinase/DNA-binding response OmpR family regulator/ligand-binding sensor domain-containing protein